MARQRPAFYVHVRVAICCLELPWMFSRT
jgi:hypothetical protein